MPDSKKPKSEKRKREKKIDVRFLPEEKEMILKKANACSLKPGTYLREVGLNKKISSTIDDQFFLEVVRLRADLGRVGGLLKAWLSPRENDLGKHPQGKEFLKKEAEGVRTILKSIEKSITEVEAVARKL